MKINKDDPRLTAYLLNEISTEDRLLVEQAIRDSSEIKVEIEKLKYSLGLLSQKSPADDDFFKLSKQQRKQIFDKISDSEPSLLQRLLKSPIGYATAGLVTASFAVMVFNHSLKNQGYKTAEVIKEEIVATEMQKFNEESAAFDKVERREVKPMALATSKPIVPNYKEVKKKEFAAAAPSPQMAKESEKSHSMGTSGAFGGGSVAEGARKGLSQNFQKLQQQNFDDRSSLTDSDRTKPVTDFLLQTEPASSQSLRETLHTIFRDCLLSDNTTLHTFKCKWQKDKPLEIDPSNTLTTSQKSCLETGLTNILGAKTDIFIIKFNSISK